MKQLVRARRVGACSLLCALLLRLWAGGSVQRIVSHIPFPKTDQLKTEEETGLSVRFLPSSQVFIPDFVESPPPLLPGDRLPVFTGEEAVEIQYFTPKEPDIPALLSQPLNWDLEGEDPAVLILHTHATESYTQTGESYVESSAWRTLDPEYNMLSIGQRVGQILAQNGITAIQDLQLHDYPSYDGSYTHARRAMENWLVKYPSIRLVLDLHRDASGTETAQMRTLCYVNEQKSAQLMVVLGANQENYETNLSLGLKLHAQLERQAPGITRPLQLRASRFNQDLHPAALLVEVGSAGNSREEALLAAQELARAIVALAKGSG